MRNFIVTLLLLSTASLCTGLGAPGYTCDPSKCTIATKCHCPSISAPGNIPAAELPQFVLITHDDAISAISDRAVRSITDGHKNPNGCNVPATWFVNQVGTDCKLAKTLWEQNHELALHTVNHAQLNPTLKGIEEEMMGVRTFLNTQCGIPLTDLVGFRSPYLIHNPTVRGLLAKNNILYDSTINEFVGEMSYTSKTFANRLYPYTFDNGIPQYCNWTFPEGQCTQTEKYPGLWEVPMWNLPYDTVNTHLKAYTMDPDKGFGGDLLTTFKTNFDQAYNGNRAPFPIFVHAPWFTPERTAKTNEFIDYALSKPNVYFVTVRQMLDWMANPVPASQLATTLKCNPTDLKAPAPPQPCLKYTIEKGDYIDLIAGKHGVPAADLLKLNPGVTATNIQPGQVVKIPPWDASCENGGAAAAAAGTPAAAPAAAAAAATPAAAPDAGAAAPAVSSTTSSQCKKWTVEPGQYLYAIAEQTSTTVDDIAAANSLKSIGTSIAPGTVLKIPPYAACCDTNTCPPDATTTTTTTTPTAPVVPETTTSTPPASTGPADRVEVEFVLQGMSETGFKEQGHDNVMNILSQLLETFPDLITVAATPVVAKRRSRSLLQATTPTPAATTTTTTTATAPAAPVAAAAGPTPNALKVKAIIATEEPAATYVKLDEEIKAGEFESLLNALGLTAVGAPTAVAYKAGVKIEDPTGLADASGNAPVDIPTTSSSSSSALSTPAIIGIAVGAGVLLLAAILTTVLCVRRKRAAARKDDLGSSKEKNNGHQFKSHQQQNGAIVGGIASLKVKTSFKGGNGSGASSIKDDGTVVKGDTPTSATYRANATNNAFMV
ncbi:hypothetical protein Ndes2526A_g03722 [Nannochloris sp. 'desiccata']